MKKTEKAYIKYFLDSRPDKDCYYSQYQVKNFKKYKKAESLFTNRFEYVEVMENVFDGNYISSRDSFLITLLLRVGKGEYRLSQILDMLELPQANHYDLSCWVMGFTARYPELVYATFTHDLEIVKIY